MTGHVCEQFAPFVKFQEVRYILREPMLLRPLRLMVRQPMCSTMLSRGWMLSIVSMCCFVGAYGSSIGQVPCKCMLQYCTILARAFLHASDSVCSAVLCFSHAEYSTVTLSMSL